ncbi:unnamed protein product [Nezara viridula]|uniref:TAFH domain-containing protein n=1 Tax=Nezara viridula TaxID=85310 RepID=A0A9P0ECQ0_NEZVI|nr:unnamed protein product [Nezara viridula]
MEGKIKEEPGTPPLTGSFNRNSKCQSSERSHNLSKVRRLLHTLIQHGEEMGCSVGDKVKNSILALIEGTITVEEFQTILLEITSCPLRPFVVPYLQTNLSILQKDVNEKTGLIKQGILDYLTSCDTPKLERGTPFVTEVFAKKRIHERLLFTDLIYVSPLAYMRMILYPSKDLYWYQFIRFQCLQNQVSERKNSGRIST